MANQVGRVRFADGTTLYPVVQGTSGGVSTRLYSSADEAHIHRNDDFAEKYPEIPANVPDAEPVDVWEWDGSEGKPMFQSSASKSLRLLVGPSSNEEVSWLYMKEQENFGFR